MYPAANNFEEEKAMYKPIFGDAIDLANYFHFEVKSEADVKRLGLAWKMYITDYRGGGCMGCIAEMLSATSGSKKATVSNSGRADCHIKYRTASGAVVPVQCERKTNGGRIETFETEFSKAEHIEGKFVIYSMDICNSTTSNLRRYVPAVVIPRKLFIEKLKEFKAIKAMSHNGEVDGYGIQVSKKALYLWLSDWPIVYDRNAVYSDEDFEGLE
jgi:hypothetical protein